MMKPCGRKVTAVITVAAALSVAGLAQSQRSRQKTLSDRDKLIGTWHLVAIHSPASNSQPEPPLPLGLFIYTADGHEAVQLMYPKAASLLQNEFVHDGYEASFGTYEIDQSKHLLRHHVIASNTRDSLVGTEEFRSYAFPDATHLILRPADPNEHWFATWEKY